MLYSTPLVTAPLYGVDVQKIVFLHKWDIAEGGPLQMLLTPALNLLLACPKNVAAGTTFGPYRKIRKVNHLYRKFGTFNNFFAKKFCKNFTSGF